MSAGVMTTIGDTPAFMLVDRWRVAREHHTAFLDLYREHVLPVVRSIPGCRSSLVLGASHVSGTTPGAWQLEVLYEFESDDILDRFHGAFADLYAQAFPQRSVRDLLDELEPWVTGHEDTTMERLAW
jgi:hypothetical protein